MDAISNCFHDHSALLKHELAYCLAQMQDKQAFPILIKVLEDTKQGAKINNNNNNNNNTILIMIIGTTSAF